MEKASNSTPEQSKPEFPTDGYIITAEAYPESDDVVALHLQYCESAEEAEKHEFRHRRFFVSKDTARILAENVSIILSAPDTHSAWETIASRVDESDCGLEEFEEDSPASE